MSTKKIILLSIIILLIGVFIGMNINWDTNIGQLGYKEQHSGQARLTNKLLDFDIPPSNELGDYKGKLEEIIKNRLQNKKAGKISVYFRDLNNGPWIGVNEKEKFIPASLLKVPLMMTYFKKAEKDPAILKKKYTYKKDAFGISSTQKYLSITPLKDNSEYTVNELIRRMIVNSDNESLFILSSNIDVDDQNQLYSKLGFPLPENVSYSSEFISPRNIGSFFRVLYNATYLNEEMSEKALQLLTETDFDRGIVAGVPKGVTVAQKYGEREENGILELHDCGIIYFPEHPYILCIMTEGTDYDTLRTIIKDISQLTYEQVKESN